MRERDHPAVYIPPPLIYVAIFFLAVALQKFIPISNWSIKQKELGWIFIAAYMVIFLPALIRFIRSKDTLVTIKPASSLQTTGIYAFTRNPMYLSLLFLYCGIAILRGNLWALLLIPLLILAVQLYVIRKEENYLLRTFGNDYDNYRKKVRRWI